jgi:hypothetical protein
MKHKFELKCEVPESGLPSVLLDWDDEADEYNLVIDGVALPTLTGLQTAGLYLALHSMRTQRDDPEPDPGATEGPRAVEAESSVPAG